MRNKKFKNNNNNKTSCRLFLVKPVSILWFAYIRVLYNYYNTRALWVWLIFMIMRGAKKRRWRAYLLNATKAFSVFVWIWKWIFLIPGEKLENSIKKQRRWETEKCVTLKTCENNLLKSRVRAGAIFSRTLVHCCVVCARARASVLVRAPAERRDTTRAVSLISTVHQRT